MENLDVYSILRSEKNYIQYWMNQNGVKITGNGLISHPDRYSFSFIKNKCFSDWKEEVALWNAEQKKIIESQRKTVSKFTAFDIDREFSILVDQQQRKFREEFKQSIRFTKETGEVDKFLNLFIDLTPEDSLCFKHWLWNVKRSVFGLKRKSHLMLNFLGPQGCGKTYNLTQLFQKTFSGFFFVEKDLKNLFDERRGKIFNSNFICFLDEMAGSSSFEQKTMIRELKQKITEDDFLFRPMRSNDYERLDQNCNFISATNESLEEILNDSTGMRRFWEFKVTKVIDQVGMDSVDFSKFWTEIDENKENGYIDLRDNNSQVVKNIISKQQETVAIDPIKDLLDEYGFVFTTDKEESLALKCSTLYKLYQIKCKEDGVRFPDSCYIFGKKLKRYGSISYCKKEDGKVHKIYLVEKTTDFNEANFEKTAIW